MRQDCSVGNFMKIRGVLSKTEQGCSPIYHQVHDGNSFNYIGHRNICSDVSRCFPVIAMPVSKNTPSLRTRRSTDKLFLTNSIQTLFACKYLPTLISNSCMRHKSIPMQKINGSQRWPTRYQLIT